MDLPASAVTKTEPSASAAKAAQRYAHRGDLTTGPVRGHLLRLSVPMVWALLAIISVQLVDTYFISLLGKNELTGMSFTFPVTMLISHLVFGLNVAMSSVISRMIGEKNMDDAKRITLHGIMLAVMVASIIAAICYLALDPIFIMLGADASTLPVIHQYMPIWLLASVVLAIPVNANSAIRAAGDTFMPSIVMITIALSNVVFSPILIFGWLGAPTMGVAGAAMGTLLAYACGLFLALYILVVKKNMLPLDGLHLQTFGNSVRRLAVIAIPVGISNIITPAMNAVIVAVLATHGPEAVAAFGVVSRIEAFSLLVVIALALGMAPIVGQNWGAGLIARVHEAINASIAVNFIWSFVVAIVFAVFAHSIGSQFTDDPVILHYIVLYFWMVPITYAFGNLVFGWSSAFNAMGLPKRAFVMIAVKSIVLTIPAIYVGSALYGVAGIFLALALVNLLAGTLFHVISQRACAQQNATITTP